MIFIFIFNNSILEHYFYCGNNNIFLEQYKDLLQTIAILDNNVTEEWNHIDSGITGTIAKSILNSDPYSMICLTVPSLSMFNNYSCQC